MRYLVTSYLLTCYGNLYFIFFYLLAKNGEFLKQPQAYAISMHWDFYVISVLVT